MIVNFHEEAAKRRDQAGRGQPTSAFHHSKIERTPERIAPKVEFGSGWYHSTAVQNAEHIQSHRD